MVYRGLVLGRSFSIDSPPSCAALHGDYVAYVIGRRLRIGILGETTRWTTHDLESVVYSLHFYDNDYLLLGTEIGIDLYCIATIKIYGDNARNYYKRLTNTTRVMQIIAMNPRKILYIRERAVNTRFMGKAVKGSKPTDCYEYLFTDEFDDSQSHTTRANDYWNVDYELCMGLVTIKSEHMKTIDVFYLKELEMRTLSSGIDNCFVAPIFGSVVLDTSSALLCLCTSTEAQNDFSLCFSTVTYQKDLQRREGLEDRCADNALLVLDTQFQTDYEYIREMMGDEALLGERPSSIAIDAASKLVYVALSETLVVYDLLAHRVERIPSSHQPLVLSYHAALSGQPCSACVCVDSELHLAVRGAVNSYDARSHTCLAFWRAWTATGGSIQSLAENQNSILITGKVTGNASGMLAILSMQH
ncbi:hypothetical protein GMRT_13791 [Giardia muris]|uniref:Uncharacterized protein n=1 Tax=Giardia muris TaxID=5742 RepID=A0A4Z1SZ27_GIAMU|nr:hypothetical protein GMRT_13791 [Giardia muris]|eukprot:TNJ28738.1 hypothetical protein GMRT_13791 [Giardia muris]